MRSLTAALTFALSLGAALPAAAGDAAFDSVVRSVESQFQTQRMHIPLFGLAKFFIKVARPEGVKQLNLAIFEDLRMDDEAMADLDRAVRNAAEGRWRPLIRVRSRGENVHIYMREAGKDVRLLVAALEADETVLVEMKVNPETLARMVNASPRRAGLCLGSENRCGD